MAHAAPLLELATELCNMDDMWGTSGVNRGGRALTLVEAINRVEIMQKTPPLIRWAANLPSERIAKQLHDQAFQGKSRASHCPIPTPWLLPVLGCVRFGKRVLLRTVKPKDQHCPQMKGARVNKQCAGKNSGLLC